MYGEEVRELLRYRDLWWNLVTRELTVKYRRSILGFFWTMLHPAVNTAVFTIVFAAIFKLSIKEFVIYLLVGLQIWNFFAQSTALASRCLLQNAQLIRKVYLPRSVFVAAIVTSQLINLGLGLLPVLLLIFWLGNGLTGAVLFLPLALAFAVLFTLGIGLMVAVVSVFFPDLMEAYQLLLMPWMYFTPVVYPLHIVPPQFIPLLKLNPMYYVVECFRGPLFPGTWPSLPDAALAALFSVGVFFLGMKVFIKYQDDLIYYV